jgi:hypothetical protein
VSANPHNAHDANPATQVTPADVGRRSREFCRFCGRVIERSITGWVHVDGGGSYWLTCSCGWEGSNQTVECPRRHEFPAEVHDDHQAVPNGNPVEEEPSDPPEPVKPCSECGGWGVLTRHDEWWTCPLCRGSGKDEP